MKYYLNIYYFRNNLNDTKMTMYLVTNANEKIHLPNFIINHSNLFRLYNYPEKNDIELPIPFNKQSILLLIKAFKKKYILHDIINDMDTFDTFMEMVDFIDCPVLFYKYLMYYKKSKISSFLLSPTIPRNEKNDADHTVNLI